MTARFVPMLLLGALLPAAPMTRPIDTSRFEAAGPDVRSFAKEVTIAAPATAVYAAWTEREAFRRVYGPDRPELEARLELAIGGRYEWLFDGETGSNGCQVLSYVPGRMLSFSWNAPPTQPESRAKSTWVVVELEPRSERVTRVRLTHLGFGTAPHWDETYAYFDAAWEHVLERMKASLERAASGG